MASALAARLDRYGEDWANSIPEGRHRASYARMRGNAVRRARDVLLQFEQDNDPDLLVKGLNGVARNTINYRGSFCGEEVMMQFNLQMYAFVVHILDLAPEKSSELLEIGKKQNCYEIKKYIQGGSC